MSIQSTTPQNGVVAEIKRSFMSLPVAQRLLLLAAVLLFSSTYANFIEGGDGSCYWMGGDELRWVIRAAAVAAGWAALRWPHVTHQKTLAIGGMWTALAMMAYGVYFAVEGLNWVAGCVSASLAQARASAMLAGLLLPPAAKDSGPYIDWLRGMFSVMDEVSDAIYPGIGAVMYVLACVILLKVSAKLSRELCA